MTGSIEGEKMYIKEKNCKKIGNFSIIFVTNRGKFKKINKINSKNS